VTQLQIILLLVLSLFVSILRAENETIVIGADSWCPVNCEPNSDNPGYMIEIAKKIFQEQAVKVEYKLMPWSRAIVEAEKGNIQAIVGAFKGDAPHFIYPQEELGLIGNSFFTHVYNPWHFQSIDSLEQITLGTIKGYEYGDTVSQYVANKENTGKIVEMTGGKNVLSRSMNMLIANRIDVIVESDIVFWHQAKKANLVDSVKFAGQASKPTKVYIAFAPNSEISKKYAKILSDGVVNLRASGELKKIMLKYGLQDWQ
jgi:polar amino acid transport system substrate-binding protein